MSTATPTAPPAPAPFAQLTESFLCTNESCGSAIRREHLASNIDPSTGVRTVRGWCEHCDRLHEAKFRLRGEQWELIGAVEVITDARRRAQFLARIAHVRGELQRKEQERLLNQAAKVNASHARRLAEDATADLPPFADAQ
jgi:hypothetical protein